MSFPITCPYCFGEMDDDQVLFRSDRVSAREQDIIPAEFDDVEDFQSRYRGADKEEILGRYAEWAFFSERDPFKDPNDPYRRFWDKYSGASTERDSLEEKLGLLPYHRPVIDPSDPAHQVYLKEQPDGSYFIRSNSGMVTQIALKSGETCAQRVCRYCRNPLPDGYGKNPVKYVTLVGVTGAGKTVYFSQLLKRMGDYAANVGLDATVAHRGVSEFLKDNQIVAGKKLPPPTPFQQFQQPLFYELVGVDGDGSRAVHTFVLYDVAGELFEEGNARYLEKFAPFIKRADGILVLIDPMQIDAISGASRQDAEKSPAATALGAIQSIVTDDNDALGCTKPVAVCLSQIDREAVQKVLDDELKRLLNANVEPERDERGFPRSATAVSLAHGTDVATVTWDTLTEYFHTEPVKVVLLMQQMAARIGELSDDYIGACGEITRMVHEQAQMEQELERLRAARAGTAPAQNSAAKMAQSEKNARLKKYMDSYRAHAAVELHSANS